MPGLPRLTAFTPLPPERNGIADYAALLLAGLGVDYRVRAACADWLAEAPPGVPVLDPALAHRDLGPEDRVLHQLGNNAGHGFVLRALRHIPGVTTLHDPGLLHLHQVAGEPQAAILAGMAAGWPQLGTAVARPLGAAFARPVAEGGQPGRADHLVLDLAAEVLARSRAVIVHSRFAADRLRLLHGAAATRHVVVIPHFLPPLALPGRAAARAALGIGEGELVVLTAGFATAAKRFDWLIAALALALGQGARLRWIHAGAERPAEYPLSLRIAEQPAVAAVARITGYLEEPMLNAYIAAADVLVNLRFPSTGESSGSIARALAAGTCCLVSDTGAYAELPRDAVLHIPLDNAVGWLAQALAALAPPAAGAPGRAQEIGAAGRRFALAELAIDPILRSYHAVIEASHDHPVAAPPPAAAEPAPPLVLPAWPLPDPAAVAALLAAQRGPCRLLLAVPGLEALAELTLDAPGLLSRLLPPTPPLRSCRVQAGPRPGLLLDFG